ncbi:unnamed protein product [Euphydryas editha]|uniref:PID domain-containing protein n=1 Tax=Euphydryas editha TaxID=104508 RepID=A0AAU9V3S0_EUPED|nr:unnamed protein product [Euphydryas editha]
MKSDWREFSSKEQSNISYLHQESGHAVPVLVVIALSGVKVCDPEDQSVRMSHALRRISYATCEAARALFAFVAREPRSEPTHQYCHAFETETPDQIINYFYL